MGSEVDLGVAGHPVPDASPAEAGRVVLEELVLVRRDRCLLSGLTVVVEPGETLAVMGPSGAGKTTLIRTIAGLVPPTSGIVQRGDGRIAMVFQDPRLLPWRTARRNVEVVLAREDRHRAVTWLERVGLGDATEVHPSALSGGMRQRVAIARALACEAPLVLVDEPFSHLDRVTAAELRHDLSTHLRSLGSAVVWVTHDPAEAEAVADRTLVMAGPPDGGWTVVEHGPAAEAWPPPSRVAPPSVLSEALSQPDPTPRRTS